MCTWTVPVHYTIVVNPRRVTNAQQEPVVEPHRAGVYDVALRGAQRRAVPAPRGIRHRRQRRRRGGEQTLLV